jgi:hypothetical protein
MYAASKDFYSLGQIRCLVEGNQWLFHAANLFHIFERYGLPFPSLLCKLVEGCDIAFLGVCEADYEEEIGVQVAVIEGSGCMSCVRVFAQEDDIGSTMFD